ncbi:MAG: TIM barrel protein [Reyranellaceae bacterium]
MTLPRLQLSVIGDEIGPTLEEMISFAHEHGLKRLDMRTVNGRNLLAMGKDEVISISRTLEKAGIRVPCFVSPLFKWPAPGQPTVAQKVDFAFDPAQIQAESLVDYAVHIAVILGAEHLRLFSYLRYDGFRPEHLGPLKPEMRKLLGHASHYDISLQLENEPVCNLGNIAELARYFRTDHRAAIAGDRHAAGDDLEDEADGDDKREEPVYLRPLVDIGNAWACGETPSDSDIATLAPLTTAIHLKDRDVAAGRTVPLGDGDVPWPAELRRLLGQVEAPEVLASIETHCPHDGRNATARSLAALRRIADEIQAEIV